MRSWGVENRAAMIDAIRLAHVELASVGTRAVVVNSAHGSGWRIAEALGASCGSWF